MRYLLLSFLLTLAPISRAHPLHTYVLTRNSNTVFVVVGGGSGRDSLVLSPAHIGDPVGAPIWTVAIDQIVSEIPVYGNFSSGVRAVERFEDSAIVYRIIRVFQDGRAEVAPDPNDTGEVDVRPLAELVSELPIVNGFTPGARARDEQNQSLIIRHVFPGGYAQVLAPNNLILFRPIQGLKLMPASYCSLRLVNN